MSRSYLAGQRSAIQLAADEFVVDKHFHCEGYAAPDEAIVYAIFAQRFNLKGTLVIGELVNCHFYRRTATDSALLSQKTCR